MSRAIRARRAFILGLIYGVLDYDVFVCEGGDRLLAASPWDVSHNYPRNRRVLRALPSYTRVTKIPLPYGIVAASLRHYAVMLCHHQAHVGHCITVYPGLLKMALIRVQAWQR